MPIRLSVLHPLMHDCCPSPPEHTSALYAAAPRAHLVHWVFLGVARSLSPRPPTWCLFWFLLFFCFFLLKMVGEGSGFVNFLLLF